MAKTKKPKFSRILLKLSGEALGGDSGVGISAEAVQSMAAQIQEVRALGVQVVVVVGGVEFFPVHRAIGHLEDAGVLAVDPN